MKSFSATVEVGGNSRLDCMRWFEAYAKELCSDFFPIRNMEEDDDTTKCIWRFPERGETVRYNFALQCNRGLFPIIIAILGNNCTARLSPAEFEFESRPFFVQRRAGTDL